MIILLKVQGIKPQPNIFYIFGCGEEIPTFDNDDYKIIVGKGIKSND